MLELRKVYFLKLNLMLEFQGHISDSLVSLLQLIQNLNITAVGKREKVLQVIKNHVTNYFLINSHKIGFSYSSDKLVKMRKYVDAVGDDVNLVFVVSAMVHGKLELDYIDDFIAIPSYPLSATMCIARITEALADKWSIL
ncbi:hypothetical protein Golax_025648 [Gossypium laxum]|uniref:Uncharacterized protein n=1 Tax=Gossypium laxum TaxID=34288 RepID=A0A7J9B234_9ROSI|nr:hypothetical protein [Gossypium laxum]